MGDDLLNRRVGQARADLERSLAPTPPAIGVVRGRTRTRRRVSGVVAAALLLLSGAVIRDGGTEGEVSVVAGPVPGGSNRDLLAPGGSRRLSDSPLSGRSTMASVWTGTEMLVWGGEGRGGQLDDGAAYHPRSDSWRKLPVGPLSERNGPAAAWNGTEMLLVGGYGGGADRVDGAAFDPAKGTWRRIADAPMPIGGLSPAVWTGREMIVLGAMNSRGAAAYDPTTDTWRVLPEPPGQLQGPEPAVVWTGTHVVATIIDGFGLDAGIFALDPAGAGWTELPRVGAGHIRLAWTGDRLLAVVGRTAAVHDPAANRWIGVAQAPGDLAPGSDPMVWTGSELLLWRGGGVASVIDPSRNTWFTTPAGQLEARPQPAAVWADGVLLIWGGFSKKSDGMMLRPTSSSAAPSAPPSLPAVSPRPPDPVRVAGPDGSSPGTIDRNGPRASWNGRILPVFPVHDDKGNLVGYFGCRFLPRSEVERDDFNASASCLPPNTGAGP